jgi:serine/threonine protein kinase
MNGVHGMSGLSRMNGMNGMNGPRGMSGLSRVNGMNGMSGMSCLNGMSGTGGQAGSWPYVPPEQLLDGRAVRPATDVWSVAATFHEVLTGVPPRDVSAARDPVAAVLETRPAPVRTRLPDLPVPVAAVLDRALEVDVDRRHRDAGELRAALLAALEESA